MATSRARKSRGSDGKRRLHDETVVSVGPSDLADDRVQASCSNSNIEIRSVEGSWGGGEKERS
jgi:hypothetical protein